MDSVWRLVTSQIAPLTRRSGALRVAKLDEMLARMKAGGLRLISAGGVPVQFGPTSRNVFVVDPNGMNLELTESTPAPSRATP